ncbi:MAG: hypothetical protein ACOZNI_28035 [Myxococcota bacterium]
MGKWKPRGDVKLDRGQFTITTPDEGAVLQELIERAAVNTVKPGHAWSRIEAKVDEKGKPLRIGYLTFHLDAHKRVLEVVETWDGKETARRTRSLDEGGAN